MTLSYTKQPIASLWTDPEFWTAWVIPFLLPVMSILVSGFWMEWAIRQPWSKPYHIRYHYKPRWKNVHHPNIVSPTELYSLAVPINLVMGVLGSTLLYNLHLEMFQYENVMENLPSLTRFLFEFVALFYLYDLVLFCGHYAFHKSDYLWRHLHSKHHQESLPTAMSGGYTTWLEATGGALVPILVGIAVVRPHALSFYAVCPFHLVTFFCYIHSGMQIPWVDRLLLQGILPFRATPRHHDAHHVKSGRQATNLGGTTWIWDWLAGTLITAQEEDAWIEATIEG